jgi:hypothetical protein
MSTPDGPKGPAPKGHHQKLQVSEKLKAALEEALRQELGQKGRVMVTSHFVNYPNPDRLDFNVDIDLEKPTR